MRILRFIGWTFGLTAAMVAGLAVAGALPSAALSWATTTTHGHTPVTICHKPGTPAEHTITVDDDAVPAHLAHGDYLGPCHETTTTTTETTTTTTTTTEPPVTTTQPPTTTTQPSTTTETQTTTQAPTTPQTTTPVPPTVKPPAVKPPKASSPPVKRPHKPHGAPPKAPPVCVPGAIETEPCGVQGQG